MVKLSRALLLTSALALSASLVALPAAANQETGRFTAPAPQQAATEHIVGIGTHNTLHGTSQLRAFAGIIGWQEISDPPDRTRLRNTMSEKGYRTFFPEPGPAKAIPISWRKSGFAFIKGGARRTHGGEAKVTPARYLNWVILKHRAANERLIVINTHFISGAWSKHPERQERWLTHARKLRDLINDLRARHPHPPILVVGDFNRHRALDLPRNVDYIRVRGATRVPLDHTYATRSVDNTLTERLPKWGSDHNAYRFRITI